MDRVSIIGITKTINKKKMANTTAMKELLEWIRMTLPMDLDTPRMIEAKIESLLAKEKEQMNKISEDWWDEGASYMYNGTKKYKSFEQYYNKTYANDTTTGLPKEDSKRRGWHY